MKTVTPQTQLKLSVGDRLCSRLRNNEVGEIWIITNIEIETKQCALKGTEERFCPCSQMCNAFSASVALRREDDPSEAPHNDSARALLELISTGNMWIVNNEEFIESEETLAEPLREVVLAQEGTTSGKEVEA